jgi:hypothetical protein
MGVPDFCARWRAFNALQVAVGAEVFVASMSHRTCPVNYSGLAVANSRSWRVPEAPFLGAPDTVRCTPDSPVNYSGVPLDFPEGDEFELESSGAPDQRCLRLSLCSFVEPNTWSFYWLSVNLWHLYNLYTRAN